MSSAASFDVPSKLPRPLTPLVGRERHVDAVCGLLRQPETRLVTLIGPGGIGKTRLALAVAERQHDEWRDGAVFVALQSITDPGLVVSAIAQTVGVRETGNQALLGSISATLQARQLLLVLDNFEQVLPAAPLITDLLAACPNLTVLVTSRAVLHLYGEHAYPIPPLDLPDPQRLPALDQLAEIEAIRLFVERAQAATTDFALTTDNAPVVAAICARVDSLPLAIELAATRTRLLSPAALLARLERRLTVLAGGPRDVPTRQQTMRDTIAWSYDLLASGEQRLFRHLSVFTGGWTLEAAVAVGSSDSSSDAGQALDVVDGLSELIDQSLVRQITQPDGSTRYAMLETLREYGRDRLVDNHEWEDVQERHAGWFVTMAAEAARHLDGNDQLPFSNQLADDLDNLRATLQWLYASGDAQRGLCMIGDLRQFWYRRGHFSEARVQATLFLGLPGATLPTACRALALATVAWMAFWQGATEAIEYAEEALAIWKTTDDQNHVPFLLLILGLSAQHFNDDLDRSKSLYEQSLAIARNVGDTTQIARTLSNLAQLAWRQGDSDRALALIDESLTVSGGAGEMQGYALSFWLRIRMSLEDNDLDRAAELSQEQLRLFWSRDDKWGVQRALIDLSMVAIARMQPDVAIQLLAAVTSLLEMTGVVPAPEERSFLDNAQSELVDVLGEAGFQATWERARTRSLPDVVAEALSVTPSSLPSPPAASPPELPTHPLSPRELDVLRGIVNGSSNQEIASLLFISPNTVTNHVANIMNKLGLDSRTAVATWAVRNGVE